jgi:hypothetical protein
LYAVLNWPKYADGLENGFKRENAQNRGSKKRDFDKQVN